MGVNHAIYVWTDFIDLCMYKDLRVTIVITFYLISLKIADDQMIWTNLFEPEAVRLHQDCLLPRDSGGDVTQDVIQWPSMARILHEEATFSLRESMSIACPLTIKIPRGLPPGAFEAARRLLGHKSSKTTMNFYSEFSTKEAGRFYDELIAKLRKSMRTGRRPRRRP